VSGEPHALFVYGTLTDPRVRARVLGRRPSLELAPARLRGYRRVIVPDYAYPFLVPSGGDAVVDGLAISGLTDADYALLDEYEDVDAGAYERVQVDVELVNRGATRRACAWVYVGGRGVQR
jgi:gamma-glutamylcyclotransferase (GGCT)/AIG2-like uncharacterized protein YtfP